MYKRILLPLDGSALAEQALPYAIAQAERFGAELVLLRVVEPIAPTDVLVQPKVAAMQAERRTKALTQEYLERIATCVQERGIPVQMVTVEGRSHTEIVQFAEANQIDLIVMCTRGQSGFSRWLMGSTADRVVRGADVPVLLVRAAKAKA